MSAFDFRLGLGLLIPIAICVGFIVCCVALCYCCCKKRNPQRHQNTTTIVYTHPPPSQLPVAGGHQPSYPAYQPLPQHAHGGLPNTTAPPPSYQEATNPALAPHNPAQMLLQPNQHFGHPDVHTQLPYNPAFYPDTASQNVPFNKH